MMRDGNLSYFTGSDDISDLFSLFHTWNKTPYGSASEGDAIDWLSLVAFKTL